jgi:hypothetical protein
MKKPDHLFFAAIRLSSQKWGKCTNQRSSEKVGANDEVNEKGREDEEPTDHPLLEGNSLPPRKGIEVIGQFPKIDIRGVGETHPRVDFILEVLDCNDPSLARYSGAIYKNDQIHGLTNP